MSACIIDDVRCPRCKAATLVTRPGAIEGGARYRYCSYVSCSWGLDEDVPYEPLSGWTCACGRTERHPPTIECEAIPPSPAARQTDP